MFTSPFGLDFSTYLPTTPLIALPDGRIVAAHTSITGQPASAKFAVFALTQQGAFDPTFNPEGRTPGANVFGFGDRVHAEVRGMGLTPSGDLTLVGFNNTTPDGNLLLARVLLASDYPIAADPPGQLAAKVRVYLGAKFTSTREPGTFQDISVFGDGVLPGGVFAWVTFASDLNNCAGCAGWGEWYLRGGCVLRARGGGVTPGVPMNLHKGLQHMSRKLRIEELESREVPATAFGLTAANQLLQFDTATPTTVTTTSITGLTAGDTVVGIDFGTNGTLFGVATTLTVNTVQLYTINPTTAVATPVSTAQTIPAGQTIVGATAFGVDVNPVTGTIQVITNLATDTNNTGNVNNFQINPTTAAVTIQNDLVFPAGTTAPETAIAFSNNAAGATQTTLFGIATGSNPDQLVTNGVANTPGETLVSVGSLGVDSAFAAFDVTAANIAQAALTVAGVTQLYTVNTTTGGATAAGNIGTGAIPVIDLAIASVGNTGLTPVTVGGSLNGQVQLFAGSGGQAIASGTVNAFAGVGVNVRSTSADVNGDSIPDVIAVTGPGTPIRVTVINGVNNSTVLIAPFDPFGGDFLGGGFVSASDIDNDGRAEFVISPDQGGGPRVTIFNLAAGQTTATVKANFFGIDDPSFRGGARSAMGDINNDTTPDLAVTAGFLGGPRAALFNGTTLFGTPTRLVGDFFAFPGTDATTLRNGVYVAAGDVNGDSFDDLIFGGGPGGAPRVFILSGALVSTTGPTAAQAAPIANFFVANNSIDRGGVRVASGDVDGDARADVIVGSGESIAAKVRIYLGANFLTTSTGEPGTFQDITVFGGAVLPGGVFVG